jgi:hypothetical protein
VHLQARSIAATLWSVEIAADQQSTELENVFSCRWRYKSVLQFVVHCSVEAITEVVAQGTLGTVNAFVQYKQGTHVELVPFTGALESAYITRADLKPRHIETNNLTRSGGIAQTPRHPADFLQNLIQTVSRQRRQLLRVDPMLSGGY